ncbi:peptide-methionine (S)-S-oxide reductase MsrA [Mesonia sp. K7]|uniref:peptide-methionine (S)-S-oxide reductase MsrA n=1 Tax=Mesonia sp. K7 TaxID=2218606 RepID=UPI000DA7CF35|nr:peptide-methionine (S)-S-oxide reductase MsrA [Mesonia sp. K7]PZD76775.1 peptide-methionine (S)-S-oxide reductase [Mesonia sp. K7]
MKLFFALITLVFSFGCQDDKTAQGEKAMVLNADKAEIVTNQNYKRAYFAGGCFWCTEAIYESVTGIKESISGYAGGHTKNPTYEQTNTGKTGHAEAIEVIYDPTEIDYATLVDVFLSSIDVTQKNGQGPDIGSQYRSIIFYQTPEEKQIAEFKLDRLDLLYAEPIAIEVKAFDKFWVAEDYHQDYKKRNPNNAYIKNVSNPRLEKVKKEHPELMKKKD